MMIMKYKYFIFEQQNRLYDRDLLHHIGLSRATYQVHGCKKAHYFQNSTQFCKILSETPKVATNSCFTIHEIFRAL